MPTPDFSYFPPISKEEWEKNALKELAGQAFETLTWNYDPDISLGPFYDSSIPPASSAGAMQANRLPLSTHAPRPWAFLETCNCSTNSWNYLNQKSLDALHSGADGLLWKFDTPAVEDFSGLFDNIEFGYCYNVFATRIWSDKVRHFFMALYAEKKSLLGWFYHDPEFADDAVCNIHHSLGHLPGFHPHCFDATNSTGAWLPPSMQVGYLLSKYIERCQMLAEEGIEAGIIARKSVFCITIGRDYFHELAKIRALRLTIAQATFELGDHTILPSDIQVYASAPIYLLSVTDPYTNLVRLTASALAAIVGGAAFISMPSFDKRFPITDTDFSSRISRNILSILRHECYLDRIHDPAQGAHFIEALTTMLAKKGWEIMQQAEGQGGYRGAAKAGFWAKKAEAFKIREEELILSRKLQIVGVNDYCDLRLFKSFPSLEEFNQSDAPWGAFEALRVKTETFLKQNTATPRPSVQPVLFGDQAGSLARLKFIQSIFPIAGIEVAEPVFAEEAEEIIMPKDTRVVVFCSSDDAYAAQVPVFASRIAQLMPGVHFCVAGSPQVMSHASSQPGTLSYVHRRSDLIRELSFYIQFLGIQ